ncbi:hypothetical protein KGQ19_00780 [Catenulispora sp. NL8]|uniref:Uncharacterized protein n=1 Tax=Catenulispora pinistramenti TaxID=2705254 RepID=A0ABS5KGN5_9ACTN|nr:hypothetical protein [Catenulispora pinistramenti]MBS2545394.1 hypothetical protein [Catenulispora pinistramenti]
MEPDVILPELRELARNATRATRAARSPIACSDPECAHRERAAALAARFTALDADLTNGGLIPMAWAGGPDFPEPRVSDNAL